MKNNKKLSSAAVSHFFDSGHCLDYNNSKIVFKNSNLFKRHIVESAIINTNSGNCINQNVGFAPFNHLVSNYILKSCKLNDFINN